jgi:hypothetical protein
MICLQTAEKVGAALDFGWRSGFTAAITGFFPESALAAEVRLRRGKYFLRTHWL